MERASKRAKKDWRSRCIESFGLLPAPKNWRDCSTEWAWERYYHFRSLTQEQFDPCRQHGTHTFVLGDEIEDSCLWSQQLRDELRSKMDNLQKEIFGVDGDDVLWDYTAWIGSDLRFKGHNRVGTVTHHAVVWSPFAIPHAVRLEHYYHHHSRAYSREFRVSWSYRLFDFEDLNFQASRKTELCSNTWNRNDNVRARNLSAGTVELLGTFLFGPRFGGVTSENSMSLDDYDDSKNILDIDDYSFLRLLFGSMATFDFGKEHSGDGFGYRWKPSEEEFQKMALEGALDGTDLEETSDISLPWLAHRIKEITHTLTSAESYYRPPSQVGDAWGYGSDGGMSEGDESPSSWPM